MDAGVLVAMKLINVLDEGVYFLIGLLLIISFLFFLKNLDNSYCGRYSSVFYQIAAPSSFFVFLRANEKWHSRRETKIATLKD